MAAVIRNFILSLACFSLTSCAPLNTSLSQDYFSSTLASKLFLERLAETGFDYSQKAILISETDFSNHYVETINSFLLPLGNGRPSIWPNCVASTSFDIFEPIGQTTSICEAQISYEDATVALQLSWQKHGRVWQLKNLRGQVLQ